MGPKSQPTSSRNARMLLAALLLFTAAIRGGVLWSMRSNLEQDPDAYREIAENLLRHGEFALGKGENEPVSPTAYRPPLYPVVLSNLPAVDQQHLSLAKVAMLHLLLGVATVWLTWLTAERLLSCRVRETHQPPSNDTVRSTHPTTAPLLAGFLVACDPILLNQQTLIMTETLAAFLAILSLWCLARFDASRSWFNAALTGGAIGLAVLCRPTFLPWLGLVGLGILLLRAPHKGVVNKAPATEWIDHLGWRSSNLIVLAFAALTVMSPWMIRNQRVLGRPTPTTTHGGYTLRLANNEHFYKWLVTSHDSLPWDSRELDREIEEWNRLRSLFYSEIDLDRMHYDSARLAMGAHPFQCFHACLYRLLQLWSPLPYKLTANESLGRRLLRYATAAWYCGVYCFALIGIWRLRGKLLQPPWIWGVLLVLVFMAVHTFYWTNLRMRAPLMPFVAIVAAAAMFKNGTRSVPATLCQ